MATISDKEVGDCWRCSPLLPPPGEEVAKNLIRKLVRERMELYSELWGYSPEKRLTQVLQTFGITAEEWAKAKEAK